MSEPKVKLSPAASPLIVVKEPPLAVTSAVPLTEICPSVVALTVGFVLFSVTVPVFSVEVVAVVSSVI